MKAVALVLLLLVASVLSTKFIFQNPKISEGLLQIMKQEVAEGVDKFDVLVFMASTVDIKRYQQIQNVDQRANFLVNDMIHNAELSQESIVAELTAKKLQFKSYWISNVIAVKNCPVDVISWLATHPLVKRVESDKPAEVELPKPEMVRMLRDNSSVEWNLEWLQASKVWEELNHWGENVTIAISDTGVHVTHPAIVKQYRGYDDGQLTHDYNWWDAGQKTSLKCPTKEPCDKAGHGTHCMGICLGSTEEHFYGMAPKAKFIGCRSIYDNTVPPSSYLECFQFLLAPTDSEGKNPKPDLRPHVITNSYRCGRCETETLHDAIKTLTAAGVMLVAAAGNDGSSCSTIIKPPGIYEEVFTVAASEIKKDLVAYFSSRGPITSDKSGRTKPDITAPGVNILSLRPPSGYTGMSGTSMATPHVAGAMALFWSAVPELKREVEKTREIIQKSARKLESKACTSTGIPNNTYGYGMLQIYDAIQTAIKESRK